MLMHQNEEDIRRLRVTSDNTGWNANHKKSSKEDIKALNVTYNQALKSVSDSILGDGSDTVNINNGNSAPKNNENSEKTVKNIIENGNNDNNNKNCSNLERIWGQDDIYSKHNTSGQLSNDIFSEYSGAVVNGGGDIFEVIVDGKIKKKEKVNDFNHSIYHDEYLMNAVQSGHIMNGYEGYDGNGNIVVSADLDEKSMKPSRSTVSHDLYTEPGGKEPIRSHTYDVNEGNNNNSNSDRQKNIDDHTDIDDDSICSNKTDKDIHDSDRICSNSSIDNMIVNNSKISQMNDDIRISIPKPDPLGTNGSKGVSLGSKPSFPPSLKKKSSFSDDPYDMAPSLTSRKSFPTKPALSFHTVRDPLVLTESKNIEKKLYFSTLGFFQRLFITAISHPLLVLSVKMITIGELKGKNWFYSYVDVVRRRGFGGLYSGIRAALGFTIVPFSLSLLFGVPETLIYRCMLDEGVVPPGGHSIGIMSALTTVVVAHKVLTQEGIGSMLRYGKLSAYQIVPGFFTFLCARTLVW
eukprot:CAMPEP_0119053284 /NCGR_PEP_ID=MMETSP1177-20130426/74338_1 /TAXON_ID=2985 /ORGANISM="Ochromonas sp, Strain CCMP1899" /LENGTH=519 /DNA_ID=CAMNT_0007033207 /DNA_START=887 /DNA_END=2443 /DNA_ORIENTATION=+